MALSLIIALLGYIILAAVAVMDKFILTKSVKSASTYAFYSSVFFLILLPVLPFVARLSLLDFGVSMFSGIMFGLGLWTMFIALKNADASCISPFIGGATAIATFLFGYFFGEHLGLYATIGVWVLALGSLLISYAKTTSRSFKHAFLWALASGALFALSHYSAKYIYDIYPFISGLVYTKFPIGLVGLALLLLPEVRRTMKEKDAGKSGPIVITDKVLGIVGSLLIQYAIALGSVTVVNALAGIQYAIIFVIAIILTKKVPHIFNETLEKRGVVIQVSALILIIIGTALVALVL